MAGPDLSIFERLQGKRTHDIELPPESGQVDPRLPAKPIDQLKSAFDAANKLATSSGDPLEGLRQAGAAQMNRNKQ